MAPFPTALTALYLPAVVLGLPLLVPCPASFLHFLRAPLGQAPLGTERQVERIGRAELSRRHLQKCTPLGGMVTHQHHWLRARMASDQWFSTLAAN